MSAHSHVGEGHFGIVGSEVPRSFARAARCCRTDWGGNLAPGFAALASRRAETRRAPIVVEAYPPSPVTRQSR